MGEEKNTTGRDEPQEKCIYLEDGEPAAACPACSARRKERSEKEYRDLMNRLNRVEGQIRGIKKMLEKDAYCTDIITQVMAANAALDSFNRVLLSEHIRTCVTDDIRADKMESVDELISLVSKLMK